MLYKEYDPRVLKKLQGIELEMLKDFDVFCRENEINYFASAGTGLGAIRHGGFIPWDDDIDIGMTRENFDRFMELSDRYPEKYSIMCRENTKDFPFMHTWISLNGSRFRVLEEPELNNGIFLDIFCFDHIFDDDAKMKRQVRSAWFWGKLLILRYIKEPVLYTSGFKKKLTVLCCRMGHYLLKLLYRDPEVLYKRARKYSAMLRGKKTERIAYMFDPTPFTSIMNMSDVEPYIDYDFEGYKIMFPAHQEAYLKRRYGENYMELPPEDKRHNHPPYELVFPDEYERNA